MSNRYYVEYESRSVYEELRSEAIAAGKDVDANGDWYDPLDIQTFAEGGSTIETARAVAERMAGASMYQEARIWERVPVLIEGIPDFDSTYREDVHPSQPIVLLGCSAQKASRPAPACELYTSPLFRLSLAYARTLTEDANIYVLSALHGLVELHEEIAPYNFRLTEMSTKERESWGNQAVRRLMTKRQDGSKGSGRIPSASTRLTVLAGADYVSAIWTAAKFALADKALHGHLPTFETPLKKKMIGERLKWLKEQIAEGTRA